MVRYELHLPVTKREARERNLPSKCAKLLVQTTDEEDVVGLLSKFIHAALSDSAQIVAQSLSTFTGYKKLRQLLEEKEFKFHFDNEISRSLKRPHDVVVECRHAGDIAHVMTAIEAEALVFYAAQPSDRSALPQEMVHAGRGGYIESEFLKTSREVPFFVFFSSTHSSVEVLGELEPVRNLFLSYFKHGCT